MLRVGVGEINGETKMDGCNNINNNKSSNKSQRVTVVVRTWPRSLSAVLGLIHGLGRHSALRVGVGEIKGGGWWVVVEEE